MNRQHKRCRKCLNAGVVPSLLVVISLLLACGTGVADPTQLNFEFDSKKYAARNGKSSLRWPRHCTVLMKVRNESKMRPLYAYGRNLSGIMGLRLDNVAGLADRYDISTKGQAKVIIDKYSVTRALDAPRIAATDWVTADPRPQLVLSIDKLAKWKPRGKGLNELMSVKGAWTEDKMKAVRPAFDVQVAGSIQAGKKSTSFTAPARVVLGQGSGFFFMTIDIEVAVKGSLLGLSGSEGEDEIKLFFTTTAYSEPPKSIASPGDSDGLDAPKLDMDLDI